MVNGWRGGARKCSAALATIVAPQADVLLQVNLENRAADPVGFQQSVGLGGLGPIVDQLELRGRCPWTPRTSKGIATIQSCRSCTVKEHAVRVMVGN